MVPLSVAAELYPDRCRTVESSWPTAAVRDGGCANASPTCPAIEEGEGSLAVSGFKSIPIVDLARWTSTDDERERTEFALELVELCPPGWFHVGFGGVMRVGNRSHGRV